MRSLSSIWIDPTALGPIEYFIRHPLVLEFKLYLHQINIFLRELLRELHHHRFYIFFLAENKMQKLQFPLKLCLISVKNNLNMFFFFFVRCIFVQHFSVQYVSSLCFMMVYLFVCVRAMCVFTVCVSCSYKNLHCETKRLVKCSGSRS